MKGEVLDSNAVGSSSQQCRNLTVPVLDVESSSRIWILDLPDRDCDDIAACRISGEKAGPNSSEVTCEASAELDAWPIQANTQ